MSTHRLVVPECPWCPHVAAARRTAALRGDAAVADRFGGLLADAPAPPDDDDE